MNKEGVTRSRGNPDPPDLSGREQELVHFCITIAMAGEATEFPACYNGAYNLRWTRNPKRITCPACLATIPNLTNEFEERV